MALPNSPVALADVVSAHTSTQCSTAQCLRCSPQLCKEARCSTTTAEGILPMSSTAELQPWLQPSWPTTTSILPSSYRLCSFLRVVLLMVKHKHLGNYMVRNVSKNWTQPSSTDLHTAGLCSHVLLATAQKTLNSSYPRSKHLPFFQMLQPLNDTLFAKEIWRKQVTHRVLPVGHQLPAWAALRGKEPFPSKSSLPRLFQQWSPWSLSSHWI